MSEDYNQNYQDVEKTSKGFIVKRFRKGKLDQVKFYPIDKNTGKVIIDED